MKNQLHLHQETYKESKKNKIYVFSQYDVPFI